MLRDKKREDHADDIEDGESQKVDFAWLVYVGMQIGYTEREVSKMTFAKWHELYSVYKRMHNFTVKRGLFEDEKVRTSLFDL